MTHSVHQLIDRQVKRWELERRAETRRMPRPCIALSRLPGSQSAALGLALAERLDLEFFGIEIVERIAREQGVQQKLVEAFDEHVRNEIDRYVVDSFREGHFLESDYLHALLRTVRSIGEGGGAVLLGRGSPYILSPARTLRVLVVSPREARIARVAAQRDLSREDAAQVLDREDEERRRFIMHHFRLDPNDPTRYDLALNTGTLPLETCCDLAVAAFEARFGRQPGAQPAVR